MHRIQYFFLLDLIIQINQMVENVSQVTAGPWQTEESLGLGAHTAEAGGGMVSLWPPKRSA